MPGVPDEGGDVAAEEVLAVAEADDERAVAPGADDDAGAVGVHRQEGERALEPLHDVAASPAVRSPTRSYSRPTSFAATSVSVSERKSTPSASSSFFSAWKFSMMPLWISASRSSSPPRCGWALPSVGPPWVAHRVCPMPVREAASGCASSAERRFSSLPARFSEVTPSAVTRATPAES